MRRIHVLAFLAFAGSLAPSLAAAPPSTVDYAYFLDVFERSSDSPEDVVPQLGLDRVETAPDDIAALFVSKRG